MQTQRSTRERQQELESICAWLVTTVTSYAPVDACEIDPSKSFASYGLSSTDAVCISGELEEWLDRKLPPTLLYTYPTIELLAQALQDDPALAAPQSHWENRPAATHAQSTQDIAVIGMAGRFPGASNVDEFWQNLRAGRESITVFSPQELIAAGGDAATVHHPAYVRARPVLKAAEVEGFDASFFGYSPREATLTDPQHRLFLECAWEAIERAGYDPGTYSGLISVFAGCSLSTYLLALAVTDHVREFDDYQLVIGHDKDSLTSTVSYKLDLKGPSFTVQTFCSTSLVAVYLACQSLLHGECDLALAGGVSVRVPGKTGYLYHEGGMQSQDGHCRAFDSEASGTLFGDGAGVVVLKRLSEALRDGDSIDAVIKGAATNNDGAFKVSYTAPGLAGQAAAISRALTQAGIDASTLGYVEAHGSATELGDPIEVAALTQAFRQQTDRRGYCGLGSVKTNVGHLDRAAGVAGLIKVVQALKHQEIPPTLHVRTPNPALDLAQSPFFLTTQLQPWQAGQSQRRASVNSLGLGGTNAHVILEEAPPLPETGASRPWQLLMLSARSASALQAITRNLHQHLQEHEELALADVAYTLQVGRKRFEQRRVLLCGERQDALRLLETPEAAQVFEQAQGRSGGQVVFLFPGIGEQYPAMASALYQQEPFFREKVDRCCEILLQRSGLDLRAQLALDRIETPTEGRPAPPASLADARRRRAAGNVLHLNGKRAPALLSATELAQPVTFVIEYALARLLMHWGVQPQALLGFSLGEYVAATLAGVLSEEDALLLVAMRARFIAAEPEGAMLAVALSEAEVLAYLQKRPWLEVDLAAVAAPLTCVLAGAVEMIAQLEQTLAGEGIACSRVSATHAFHSRLLAPVREQLIHLLEEMTLAAPTIPYISNVSGTWISDAQATSPAYWAEHLCGTVRFADGVGCLLEEGPQVCIEVGIGQALGSFVRQHPAFTHQCQTQILATQPVRDTEDSQAFFLTCIARLWLAGIDLNWPAFYAGESRRRVALPTYPFERQRCWLELPDWRSASSSRGSGLPASGERRAELANWFSVPGWRQAPPTPTSAVGTDPGPWLVFLDEAGVGADLVRRLAAGGAQVVVVEPGPAFEALNARHYRLRPCQQADYQHLLHLLACRQLLPTRILHCWSVTTTETDAQESAAVQQQLDASFASLLALAQACGEVEQERRVITVLASGLYDVLGQEPLSPAKATLLGPCQVIPQEYPTIDCQLIEITRADLSPSAQDRLVDQLAQELAREPHSRVVALRGQRRWLPTFEAVQLATPAQPQQGWRERGIYLITGGLGGIGLALATHLAGCVQARLVLTSRQGLPPRSTWPALLRTEAEESPLRQRISAIQAMEQQGAQVLVMAADVADEAQMQQVIACTMATFGGLHGVLHLAGVPGAGLIQLKTPTRAAAVLAPKVQGTLVLDRLLRAVPPLDFVLLFSSITAVIGGPGQVDYSAANAFLDAYARSRHSDLPVCAIDWGEWQWNAWSQGLAGYNEATRAFFEENRRTFGISFAEGMQVLSRVLGGPLAQVVVSPRDMQALVTLSRTLNIHSHLPWEQEGAQPIVAHARPPLQNSYVAPRNADERKMARLWEELLAISDIGIYDNFFDLGGNSLLGVNLLLQIRKEFHLEQLPAYVLYEAPCIEAMTGYLTHNRGPQALEALEERSSKRQSLLKKRMRGKHA
ncbi:MAG TPA: SDR family NAD(P)-dependent oxidoreductase [Ktedonobacteraceae bacterium]|jgi:acyl transferase domain-containing protein/acyl carrier protein